jgi:hypothetical protein
MRQLGQETVVLMGGIPGNLSETQPDGAWLQKDTARGGVGVKISTNHNHTLIPTAKLMWQSVGK